MRKPGEGRRLANKLPLVHLVHGGPHGIFGDGWHRRWNAQRFAADGYATALVNFHGSTSRGQAFTASILGSWGDQPYEDVMRATDALVARGIADPRRMAVAGGSYGGYLVAWIAAQTDRFRCVVNHAGVCDLQAQFASDFTHGRPRAFGERADQARVTSPRREDQKRHVVGRLRGSHEVGELGHHVGQDVGRGSRGGPQGRGQPIRPEVLAARDGGDLPRRDREAVRRRRPLRSRGRPGLSDRERRSRRPSRETPTPFSASSPRRAPAAPPRRGCSDRVSG